MADTLTVLDECRISPPPGTVGEQSLPLTFFDLTWLPVFPSHQLFMYEFHHPKTHFTETILPDLKNSLSITLKHFFPFAGNLIVYPKSANHSRKPEIRHSEGDSVAVTIAESSLDFNDLIGNHPRSCDKFHNLVPRLAKASKVSNHVTIPVFALQITLFPNSGISVGLTNLHVLCDASTKVDFLKAWTAIAKHGTDDVFLSSESISSLPFYGRVINYPDSLDEIYMHGIESFDADYQPVHLVSQPEKVRGTFVLTRPQINRLKSRVSTEVEYVSSFSVACAFIWSCIAKSAAEVAEKKGNIDDEEGMEKFNCAVDWRGRMDPPLPRTYFGNCVGPCTTKPTKTKLLASENGLLTAAELIGKSISETVKKNKDEVLKDAEKWIEGFMDGVPVIGVAGSPKIKLYDTDLGFGRPIKYETISIDYNRSISFNVCRDSPEDFEIGFCLPAEQMDAFIVIFGKELE